MKSKNLKLLVIGVVVMAVVLGAVLILNKDTKSPATNATLPRIAAVHITATSFEPSTLTIKAGTTVTWTNTSQSPHKIASNPHPEHTDLQGLLSGLLNENDTYSYTYAKSGNYGYHDEINPSINGSVVVKE